MSKIKEFFKSRHIQIALATGASIIILAYFSKRVLPEPMTKLPMSLPPFLMLIYESLLGRCKDRKICRPAYWIAAIFILTGLVILIHAV